MRTWRLDLDSDAHAPRLARHSVRSWLELVACDDDTKADVVLVVSEFVTDAVATAASRVVVRIVFDEGRLRIDVHAEHDQPTAATSGSRQLDTQSEPFGDRIVTAVTDAWDRTSTPHGPHNWAEILC